MKMSLNRYTQDYEKRRENLCSSVMSGTKLKGNSDLFEKGRMCYQFSTDASLPRTLVRATLSKNNSSNKVVVVVPQDFLDLVQNCCSRIDNEKPPEIEKTLTQVLPPALPQDDDDDDDIFADVGKFDTQEFHNRTAADAAAGDGVGAGLDDDDERLAELQERIATAGQRRLDEDEMEQKREEEKKLLLEQIQERPAGQNPFSLKNASLIPLVGRAADACKVPVLISRRDDFGDFVDEEYGISTTGEEQESYKHLKKKRRRGPNPDNIKNLPLANSNLPKI
jgi:hypothetical protein